MDITFVIPALNEEAHIQQTIEAIKLQCSRANIEHEVVLVDNGSQDRTAEIASNLGAQVLIHPGLKIGALRNRGVRGSKGDLIVFLDADVEVTDAWGDKVSTVVSAIRRNRKIITGSHCSPPPSSSYLLKYWFTAFANDARNTHLGSGHLIVARTFFSACGGFDESMETGEDYEFCERAMRNGAELINEIDLKVLHYGFPETIGDFVRRERWHGRSDFKSFYSIAHSKVALSTIVFIALNLCLTIGLAVSKSAFVGGLILLTFFHLLASYMKFSSSGVVYVLANAPVLYAYFLGRSLALYDGITRRE